MGRELWIQLRIALQWAVESYIFYSAFIACPEPHQALLDGITVLSLYQKHSGM
jgi:hypothetical protein